MRLARSSIALLAVVWLLFAAPAPALAESAAARAGHSAVWWDPARSGEGWVLEVLPSGDAVLYWFTYDEAGGQRWLGGVGRPQDGALEFPDLYVSRGGRFGPAFDPDEVVLERVGSAWIRFDDCEHGRFEYAVFGQSGSLAMSRFSSALGLACDGPVPAPVPLHAGQTGSWYQPLRSGEGLNVQWLDRDRAVVVWYTYDHSGAQMWLVGSGQREDARLRVPVYLTRGGRFGADFDPAEVEQRFFGELVIELDCSAGELSWASSLAEFPDGTLALQPLTRLAELPCPFASPALSDLAEGGWDHRFSLAGVGGRDGFAPRVHDLLALDDDGLLAAGYFRWLGPQRMPPVMRRRDGQWQPAWSGQLGGAGMVTALARSDSGRFALATDLEIRVGDEDELSPIASIDGLVRRLLWRGDMLWAAGWFALDNGLQHLVRWDGATWRAAPGGAVDGPVYALEVDGDALWVGGDFTQVGGIAARSLARLALDGWSALDLPARVLAIEPAADGLYVGGSFSYAGTDSGGIVRRGANGWEPVGRGFSLGGWPGVVHDLEFHAGRLHAFGCFSQSGEGATARPLAGIARLEDDGWQPLGQSRAGLGSVWFSPGLCGFEPAPWVPWYVGAHRLRSTGAALYLGGDAPGAGGVVSQGLIAWQDGDWIAQGEAGLGLSGGAALLAVEPEGRVLAFGAAAAGGEAGRSGLFRFDGGRWAPLGPALPPETGPCRGLQVDPQGRIHLACSHQPRLPSGDDDPTLWRARLLRLEADGWRELSPGHGLAPPTALAQDHAGRLYLAGGLIYGTQESGYVARLEGESLVVIEDRFDSLVTSLALAPAGTYEDLVVSGTFTRIGAGSFRRIAQRRDGQWRALGAGLAVPAGALLHEGGQILAAANADAGEGRMVLGRWRDGAWSELARPEHGFPVTPADAPPTLHALARAGGRLYLAGEVSGEDAGSHVLVYEDGRFHVLGGGLHALGGARSVLSTGDALWFGGDIAEAGAGEGLRSSVGIARFGWDRHSRGAAGAAAVGMPLPAAKAGSDAADP